MAQPRELPEELLERIFEHLAFPVGARVASATGPENSSCADYLDAIRNVCSASKLFHHIASPILYRALPHLQGSRHIGRLRGPHYLRTLFLRPEYRGVLQYLAIDLWPLQSLQKRDLGDIESREVYVAIRQQVLDLFHSFESGNVTFAEIDQRLVAAEDESIMALILLLCPDITRLDLHHDQGEDFKNELLAEMLAIGAAVRHSDARIPGILGSMRPRVFENVRIATLHATNFGDWDDQLITDIMRLPALEELSIEDITGVYWGEIPAPFLQHRESTFLHISKVRLLDCEGFPYLMAELLKRCPSLSSLKITFSSNQPRMVASDPEYLYHEAKDEYTDYEYFGPVLSESAPRLEALTLANSFGRSLFCLGSCLHGMVSLRTLALDVDLIWPLPGLEMRLAEVIPRSIASLQLLAQNYYNPWRRLEGATHEAQLEHLSQMDGEVRGLLQDGSYQRLVNVTVDYHAYLRWGLPERSPEGIQYRRRDVYDEEVVKCGWTMTEDHENRTQTLERQPSHRP